MARMKKVIFTRRRTTTQTFVCEVPASMTDKDFIAKFSDQLADWMDEQEDYEEAELTCKVMPAKRTDQFGFLFDGDKWTCEPSALPLALQPAADRKKFRLNHKSGREEEALVLEGPSSLTLSQLNKIVKSLSARKLTLTPLAHSNQSPVNIRLKGGAVQVKAWFSIG